MCQRDVLGVIHLKVDHSGRPREASARGSTRKCAPSASGPFRQKSRGQPRLSSVLEFGQRRAAAVSLWWTRSLDGGPGKAIR